MLEDRVSWTSSVIVPSGSIIPPPESERLGCVWSSWSGCLAIGVWVEKKILLVVCVVVGVSHCSRVLRGDSFSVSYPTRDWSQPRICSCFQFGIRSLLSSLPLRLSCVSRTFSKLRVCTLFLLHSNLSNSSWFGFSPSGGSFFIYATPTY